MSNVSLSLPWEDWGLTISIETVSEQAGDHATDKVIVSDRALIPVLVDVDKFRAKFGDAALLKCINGTSLRVVAQRVNRTHAKSATAVVENALVASIMSVRAAGVVRTIVVTKYALPDGSVYEGAEEEEYQAAYAAALIDSGVDGTLALSIAKTQKLV